MLEEKRQRAKHSIKCGINIRDRCVGLYVGVIALISYFFKQANKQNLGSKKYLFIYLFQNEGRAGETAQAVNYLRGCIWPPDPLIKQPGVMADSRITVLWDRDGLEAPWAPLVSKPGLLGQF